MKNIKLVTHSPACINFRSAPVEVTITSSFDLELAVQKKNQMFSPHLAADGKQIQIMKMWIILFSKGAYYVPEFISHPHKYILYSKTISAYCFSWNLSSSYCCCLSFCCNLFPVRLPRITRERGNTDKRMQWDGQLEWKGKCFYFV